MRNTDEQIDWQRGACQTSRLTVRYWRSGGHKPSLVGLHGLFGNGACLLPMARALAGFDVVLPDARGHGGTSSPVTGYRYTDHARDVIELIKYLKLDRPILIGHSMGGMTAALAAAELGSSVRAVVLIDPTFLGAEMQREVYESGVGEEHQQLLKRTRDSLINSARQKSPNRSVEMIRYLVDARLQTSINACDILTPPNPDWREVARTINAPTLLVTAERGIVSREVARELQGLNFLFRHKHVANIGHGLPYDATKMLGSILTSFLAQVAAFGPGVASTE
ncbi:alpha/beta fold hydrolase [Brucella pseudogrignonensis]|uniref:alpha/beta fold hydrolase n=1 Tax=Brucella pseudogrignonensis TaxID=419475 RepID=UPI0038B55F33